MYGYYWLIEVRCKSHHSVKQKQNAGYNLQETRYFVSVLFMMGDTKYRVSA